MLLQGTLCLPIWAAFLFLGTALWAWVHTPPDGAALLAEPPSLASSARLRSMPMLAAHSRHK